MSTPVQDIARSGLLLQGYPLGTSSMSHPWRGWRMFGLFRRGEMVLTCPLSARKRFVAMLHDMADPIAYDVRSLLRYIK